MRNMRLGLGVAAAVAIGAGGPQSANASVVTITPNPIEIEAAPGKSAAVTVNIRNSGADPLEAMKPEVEGAAFSLVNVDCPASLAPQDTCDVKISYRAPGSGKATGQFVLRAGSGIAATADITGLKPGSGGSAGGCKVPKLTGLTLAVAKSRLKAAGCRLGKVIKPSGRTPSGSKLVVKSSSPRAGATVSDCDSVKLTLKFVKKRRAFAATREAVRAKAAQAPPSWRTSTASLTLTAEAQGETSAAFQVFNDGPSDLVGLFLEQSPPNNRFQRENGCPATLAAGASCTIKVIYLAGSDTATDKSTLLIKADNDPNGTKSVALTGRTKAASTDDGGCF